MRELKLKANAKINLSLNVLGKNGDMHILDMIMSTVDIFDIVTIKERKDDEITFASNLLGINNSAIKAARLIQSKFPIGGVHIKIKKNIPFMAGLGGSSADASAVIFGLCNMFNLDINDSKMQEIALKTGSDVPYMIGGGFCRVLGTGEKIVPFKAKNALTLLLVVPRDGVSTKECFAKFDEMPDENKADNTKIIKALGEGDLNALTQNMYNMLEDSAKVLLSDIEKIIMLCTSFNPLKTMMTGSGSGIISIFDNDDNLNACQKMIKSLGLYCRKINTLDKGIEIQ